MSEFIPFSNNSESMGTLEGTVTVFENFHLSAEHFLGVSIRHWIMGLNDGSSRQQALDDRDRWCVPNIIRARLECQPPDCDRLSFESAVEVPPDLFKELDSLPFVDLSYRPEYLQIEVDITRRSQECPEILWKTGASKAYTGK